MSNKPRPQLLPIKVNDPKYFTARHLQPAPPSSSATPASSRGFYWDVLESNRGLAFHHYVLPYKPNMSYDVWIWNLYKTKHPLFWGKGSWPKNNQQKKKLQQATPVKFTADGVKDPNKVSFFVEGNAIHEADYHILVREKPHPTKPVPPRETLLDGGKWKYGDRFTVHTNADGKYTIELEVRGGTSLTLDVKPPVTKNTPRRKARVVRKLVTKTSPLPLSTKLLGTKPADLKFDSEQAIEATELSAAHDPEHRWFKIKRPSNWKGKWFLVRAESRSTKAVTAHYVDLHPQYIASNPDPLFTYEKSDHKQAKKRVFRTTIRFQFRPSKKYVLIHAVGIDAPYSLYAGAETLVKRKDLERSKKRKLKWL